MADRERSAEEREAARREREARRAARMGRRAPRDVAPDVAEPERAHPEPEPVESEPGPEYTEPEPVAPEPVAPEPVEPELVEPDPGEVAQPSAQVPDPAELVSTPDVGFQPAPQLVSPRPMKSFPSPPDPEFYAEDDELEVPSGTRRVSRLSGRQLTVKRRSRPPRPPRRPRTPKVAKRHPWRGRIASLIALVVAAALIWFLVELFQPFGTSPHGHVTVRIPPSSTSGQVGKLLSSAGVISSGFFFELRATLAGDRGDMRAGTYHLQKGMGYGTVLKKLTTAPPTAKTSVLTIAEGHTRAHVAQLLRQQGIKGNYVAATRHSPVLDPRSYGAPRSTPSLEGFLFPDTFRLVQPVKVSALVSAQLKDFKRRFATVDLGYAHRHHLSAYEVLTVASLIEGEASRAQDRSRVASVIYNRLRDGMMLQLDSTTRYATGNLTKPLTPSQLHSPSPYNTRTHAGLPPTPINSPGLASIDAAAHPASTSYLYFFTKPCTNENVFAYNYAQFQGLLLRDKRTHCG